MTRFHDPRAGVVLLDGRDLRDYRLTDLRDQFAIVPQDLQLFSTSIAENIRYGNLQATDAQVEAAARAAHAGEFIRALPENTIRTWAIVVPVFPADNDSGLPWPAPSYGMPRS